MEKATGIAPAISAYLTAHRSPDDSILLELQQETRQLGGISRMQVAPNQGQLLGLLVAASGARQVVEVGSFTGYSALCMARRLPEDGRLICCDISEEYTAIARRYWEKAGLADKIELRLGPALDTLRALPAEESIDLAFIDADKQNYLNYVREIIPRLRRHGLILVDNVLWSGSVVNDEDQSELAISIREFNERILEDDRVESVMIAIADGLSILRKR